MTTASGEWRGELLEVRANGLVLMSDGRESAGRPADSGALNERRIVFVSYAQVRRGDFERVDHSLAEGREPTPDHAEQLRLLSRFPQGLSPELLERLLRTTGQQAVEAVQP